MRKCADGSQKINFSKHKQLLPLAVGNIDVSIDGTHDTVSHSARNFIFPLFGFSTYLSFFRGKHVYMECSISVNKSPRWILFYEKKSDQRESTFIGVKIAIEYRKGNKKNKSGSKIEIQSSKQSFTIEFHVYSD